MRQWTLQTRPNRSNSATTSAGPYSWSMSLRSLKPQGEKPHYPPLHQLHSLPRPSHQASRKQEHEETALAAPSKFPLRTSRPLHSLDPSKDRQHKRTWLLRHDHSASPHVPCPTRLPSPWHLPHLLVALAEDPRLEAPVIGRTDLRGCRHAVILTAYPLQPPLPKSTQKVVLLSLSQHRVTSSRRDQRETR